MKTTEDKINQIPPEFKEIAKEFADKGFAHLITRVCAPRHAARRRQPSGQNQSAPVVKEQNSLLQARPRARRSDQP